MLDSSENFSPEEFDEMKESVAELVDAGFDLAPDVARIGFVIYRLRFEPNDAMEASSEYHKNGFSVIRSLSPWRLGTTKTR